jgi:hypothetical protein
MSANALPEFQRAGWERAASRHEEFWADTVRFVEALLDAAAVRAGSAAPWWRALESSNAMTKTALRLALDAVAYGEHARAHLPSWHANR